MPAPDTKVLNYILNLYNVYDKKEEEDDKEATKPLFSFSRVISFAETAKDYITGNAEIKKTLNKICDDVKYAINSPNKTPEDWINIIFDLGDKAAIAQSVKPTAGQSRCCEILHAMRNEIVKTITKEEDDYKKAFDEKIDQLKNKIVTNDEKGDGNVLDKNGVGVEELDKEIMLAYRQLAYLEDKVSIRRAKRYGLINHLLMINEREEQFRTDKIRDTSVCHFTGNKAIPYLLQSEACETLYADKYQKLTNYSFADFRLKGIPSKDKKLPESKKTQAKSHSLSAKDDKKEGRGEVTSPTVHVDDNDFEDLSSAENSDFFEHDTPITPKKNSQTVFRMFGKQNSKAEVLTTEEAELRSLNSPNHS